jgi:hypothetical protein
MSAPILLRLPVELHLHIVVQLELRERANFASTNRYFRSIIQAPTHAEFLLAEASIWAKEERLFACRGCGLFRRYTCFADDMIKGKRCRSGTQADTRFCLECGIAGKLYTPGTHLAICGQPHVLCQHCKILKNRVGSQGTCADCSPCPRWTFMQLRSSGSQCPDHDHDWLYTTSRSSDSGHIQEYYGVWPEL